MPSTDTCSTCCCRLATAALQLLERFSTPERDSVYVTLENQEDLLEQGTETLPDPPLPLEEETVKTLQAIVAWLSRSDGQEMCRKSFVMVRAKGWHQRPPLTLPHPHVCRSGW
jgi:hypothetical protein